jgi:fumarate reductase subunit D
MEPVLWLLFSAGGVLSALFLPALVFLFAFALPLGWIDDPGRDRLLGLVGHPLSALVLLGVCVLSLMHWAQRFRYTLFDGLRLKPHQRPINTVVYALALLGSAAAVVVLWQAVSARGG